MNSRTEWQWRLVLILLIAVVMLGICALAARAGPTRVHGIVQDNNYQPVPGGHIRIEHEYDGLWYVEFEDREMQGHAFGWDLTKDGNYRVSWSKVGYETTWIRSGEFTLATAPFGDIQVNVRRVVVVPTATATPTTVPVPTTLYPPTIEPTMTTTPEPACLEFQQFSWAERMSVRDGAAMRIGGGIEDMPDWDNDLTLIHGLYDQLLGAPLTRRFETMGLTARAFCNGILTMRPVAREECMDYGVITWDATQNWMEQ